MHRFHNHIKYRGQDAEVKFSFSQGGLDFQGKTKGLAIKYVCAGHEHYSLSDTDVLLGKGEFIILRNNENYLAKGLKSDKVANGICIDLLEEESDNSFFTLSENQHLFNIPFSCNKILSIGTLLNDLASQGMQGEFLKTTIPDLHLSLQELNIELIQYSDRLKGTVKKINTQKILISKFIKTRNFIHNNFKTKINLDALARFTGVSKYHFIRLFGLLFEQSPKEMQLQLKMDLAREMVLHENHSFSKIAIELGYTDLSSFSKSFRKFHGSAPSKFIS